MIDQCADCAAELDHCHGALIVHREGVVECTEDGCFVLEIVRHDMVLDCASLAGDCDCREASALEFLRSA